MNKSTKLNLDIDIYIVVDRYESGDVINETSYGETREEDIFEDLKAANDPQAVIYCNPVEGVARDVSEDFARKWLSAIYDEIEEDLAANEEILHMKLPPFIAKHIGQNELDDIVQEIADEVAENRVRPEFSYS